MADSRSHSVDCPNTNPEKPSKKKADRAKMQGIACPCCQPYYDALGLSPKSKKDHINVVSRHRYVVPPPRTPEHYWEVDFPSSSECKQRGYTNVSTEPYTFRSKKNKKRSWRQLLQPQNREKNAGQAEAGSLASGQEAKKKKLDGIGCGETEEN